MNEAVLLVIGIGNDKRAEEAGLLFAEKMSKRLVVLQILDSPLYHYGSTDVIVPAYARTQFLFHIQDNVRKEAAQRSEYLKSQARARGIGIEIRSVETDDHASAVEREAAKGYEKIFLPKEPRRLFPIFGKTVVERLRKRSVDNVFVC